MKPKTIFAAKVIKPFIVKNPKFILMTMTNLTSKFLLLSLCFSLFSACKDDEETFDTAGPNPLAALNLPAAYDNYANPDLPMYMVLPPTGLSDNTPANNPVTNSGATLGRVLFYDVNLSANKSISCANCHQQKFGFSDPLALSKGFNGGNTGRHSMSLANARYYNSGRFFWDERAATLEDQVLGPIQDAVEMGMTLPDLT